MQTAIDTILPIIVTTIIFLTLSIAVIYALIFYQRKKFRHQKELVEVRETYNQALLQSKLAIQEQTLDHISKELHANISHLVSLININLSEILPQTSAQQHENIKETKSLVKQLMSEIRALSASLNTDHIIHIGFVKALENELNRIRKPKAEVTKSGEPYRLQAEHETILFRLCQEVLNNIVKYAGASKIQASLAFSPEHFMLTIADDGIGFDEDEALKRSGEKQSTGLLNMKKRATLINATFNIVSRIGEGTIITINIPNPEKV
jgi:signal transduction histidine kinase